MKKVLLTIIAAFILSVFLPMSPSALADDGSTIVYITRTGECYHIGTCSYLKSKIETTLADAVAEGYRPCSRCHPPRLDSNETSIALTPSETYTPPVSESSSSSKNAAAAYSPSNTSKDDSFLVSPTTLIIACVIVFFIGKSMSKSTGAKRQAAANYTSDISSNSLPANPDNLSPPPQSIAAQSTQRRATRQVVACPKCGKTMVKRYGRYGSFYGCSNFPYCRGTRSINH